MEAIRNNILLQSYAEQTLTLGDLNIRARGDATINSGNGITRFLGAHNILFNAADDMVLDAHDGFSLESSSLQVSSRDIYLLSDGESHFQTSDGIFDATSSIQLYDGALLTVETTVGDILLTVTGGNIRSTGADYTKFISEKTVTFTADQSISFISNQGIDLRAERGDIYVGKTVTGLPDLEPINFSSDDYVRFKGSDVLVNITSIDGYSGDFIKFEAELRSSTITIEVEDNFITATNGTFFLGSSGITVNSDRDLILAARNDLTISASYTSSSNILLDASNTFTERANNFEAHTDLFIFNSFDDIDFTSTDGTTLRSLKATTFDIGTTLSIDIDNAVNINAKRNSLYKTGPLVFDTNSVDFFSGSIDLVAYDLFISSVVSSTINTHNAQFDADDFSFGTATSADYIASRFVLHNGDQSYQYETITLNGNTFFTSPPNKDISLSSSTLITTGPFSINSATVQIFADDVDYSPHTFTVTSDVEYPINVNAASFTQYAHDTYFGSNDFGYFDNEFIFDGDSNIDVFADTASLSAEHLITYEIEDEITIRSADTEISAYEVDFIAGGAISFTLTGGGDGSLETSISVFERLRFYSFDDLFIDSIDGHTIDSTTTFIRTLDTLQEQVNDSGDYSVSATELSFTGGAFTILDGDTLTLTATDSLNYYAEDEFLFSAAIVGDFDADSIFEMHSDNIFFTAGATNSISADQGADLIAAEGGEIVLTQLDDEVLNSIHSDTDTFILSNDELIYDIGGDFDVLASDITIDSYAQDAGQYYYSTDSISITADIGNVTFVVADVGSNGGAISITADISATFEADGAISIQTTGSTYDPYLAYNVGILSRADDDLSVVSLADVILIDESSSSFLASSGSFSHTGGTATLESTDQSIVIDSDTDVVFEGGSLTFDINDYSIWQATRDILMDQGTNLAVRGSGAFDVIADRGEVSFIYNGDELMSWTATSINSQGADDFIWLTGITGVQALSIEYFGDAELTFTAVNDISYDVTNNAHITSSLNNDILYNGGGDLTVDPVGFASFTSVKDSEWLTTGDAAYSGADVKFISKGSLNTIADQSLAYVGEDFVGTIYNYADFEVEDTINIGIDTPGIVTFNLGGNTLNYGAKIDTVTTSISSLPDSDVLFDSTIYESFAGVDNTLNTANAIAIESQGTNSVGEDIYFTSTGDLSITSGNSIASTAASIHYDYNNDLEFIASGLFTIQSATFLHFDLDQDFRIDASVWRTTANAFSFNSVNDASFSSAAGAISFGTSKTMVFESDQDTLFKTTGSTTFRTDQSNSPITFYSQDSTSRFILAANALTATSVAKLDFIGKNGFDLTASSVSISAADTFKTDTKGDIEYIAARNLKITAQATRSNIDIQSTGEIFSSAVDFVDSGVQQISFIPDQDLSFIVGVREDAILPEIIITASDDFSIDTLVGGLNYNTVYDTNWSAGVIDWIVNGINSEYQFGASFASDFDLFLEGNNLLVTSENLYANTGYGLSYIGGAKSSIEYTLLKDISFHTTEHPTEIQIFADSLTASANEIFIRAFGNEPSSGWLDISGNAGFVDAALSPVLQTNDRYTVAFQTTASGITFSADEARILAEVTRNTAIYQDQSVGHLVVRAAGSDEYLRGIETVASTIEIRSGLTVTNRAENIIFKELYGNPDTVLAPSVNDFLTEAGRPSIVSIHDQTWTSYGENHNGNGIEFTSTVPIYDIGFEVETIVFDSSHSMQILGGKGFTAASIYDADVISHSSIIMEAQGAGVDSNSVYISAGKDSTSTTLPLYIGPDIRYYADLDIYLDSVDKIVAEIRDNIRIEAEGDLVHSAGNGIDITVPYHTLQLISIGSLEFSGPNIHITGYDINFSQTAGFTMVANGLQGSANIYFGSTDIEGNSANLPTLDFNAANLIFDSPNVDITSDTALIMPSYVAPGACVAGTIWFFDNPAVDNLVTSPVLGYCDQTGVTRTFALLDD